MVSTSGLLESQTEEHRQHLLEKLPILPTADPSLATVAKLAETWVEAIACHSQMLGPPREYARSVLGDRECIKIICDQVNPIFLLEVERALDSLFDPAIRDHARDQIEFIKSLIREQAQVGSHHWFHRLQRSNGQDRRSEYAIRFRARDEIMALGVLHKADEEAITKILSPLSEEDAELVITIYRKPGETSPQLAAKLMAHRSQGPAIRMAIDRLRQKGLDIPKTSGTRGYRISRQALVSWHRSN